MPSRSSLVLRVCVRLCLGLVLLAGLCLALGVQVRPAHAQTPTTFTVTDCIDDSQLRADVGQANTDNDGDIITFTCSGDIPLTSFLFITGSMTLDGSQSPQGVTLDGQNSVQVLIVRSGTVTLNALTIAHGAASFTSGGGIANEGGATLTITNSTISNNSISGSYGGGISNGGTLTITNSTISNNSQSGNATGGGLVNFGTATITNSTFSGNSATEGGGLFNFGGGTLTISTSTFANNSASDGGGLANEGTLTITNSTVANNSASNGGGLAIFSTNAGPSTVTINTSTFSGNSANFGGGGISNGATLTISNSTFSGNSAPDGGGGGLNTGGAATISNSTFSGNSAAAGGGIADSGTLTLSNSTVANNSASIGGGIEINASPPPTMNSSGSIVADNTVTNPANVGGDCNNQNGILNDNGYNLDSDRTCFSAGTSLHGNPQLGPLANNGGPTQTLALQQNSPAIDAGPPAAQCPPTDQRGVSRPDDSEPTCDIGADESNYPPDGDLGLTVPAPITTNATSPQGATVTYSASATDESGESSSATVSCTPASGSVFPIGTTTVTCTATDSDDSNSPVTQSFPVTVNDTDLGLSNVPANITTKAISSQGAVVTYTSPTAVDEDSPLPAVNCSPASGSTFPVGTTKVTCTVSDSDDTPSSASASFSVTVTDTDLGLTNVPSNMTVNATSPQGAVVTYSAPTVVDEDNPLPAVKCSPASGSTFAIGTTTVKCTVTDTDDTPSSVSASFSVTVNGAATQVSNLITTVNSFGLPPAFQASFDTQLQAVQTDLTNHNSTQACRDLGAFINHVKAQSGKGLTVSQANQLLAAATNIQHVLAC